MTLLSCFVQAQHFREAHVQVLWQVQYLVKLCRPWHVFLFTGGSVFSELGMVVVPRGSWMKNNFWTFQFSGNALRKHLNVMICICTSKICLWRRSYWQQRGLHRPDIREVIDQDQTTLIPSWWIFRGDQGCQPAMSAVMIASTPRSAKSPTKHPCASKPSPQIRGPKHQFRTSQP